MNREWNSEGLLIIGNRMQNYKIDNVGGEMTTLSNDGIFVGDKKIHQIISPETLQP